MHSKEKIFLNRNGNATYKTFITVILLFKHVTGVFGRGTMHHIVGYLRVRWLARRTEHLAVPRGRIHKTFFLCNLWVK
jgi:hypothetical protein